MDMGPVWEPRGALAAAAVVAAGGLGILLPAHDGVSRAHGRTPWTPKLPGPKLTPERKIQLTGNRWAVLFAAGYPTYCDHMTKRVCVREWPLAFRKSFRGAVVDAIAIEDDRALARFSNGSGIGLVHV